MSQISRNVINFPNLSLRAHMEFKDIEKVSLASYPIVHSSIILFLTSSFIDRWNRCRMEPRQFTRFGTECPFRPKFTFLNCVPPANPWIAWSFSAIEIGSVLRISSSNSRNLGIFYGRFIVRSKHPCKDPAKENQSGFSFVIEMMLWAIVQHASICFENRKI